MRLAIVIGSTYEKHPSLPTLASSGTDVEVVADALGEYDVGFSTIKLVPTRGLAKQIERVLTDSGEDAHVLIYFSGHAELDEDGPRLMLDHRLGGRLGLERLAEALRDRRGASAIVLDTAHPSSAEDPAASATLVGAARDVLEPSAASLLIAARPRDRSVPAGPSLFTRLFVDEIERNATGQPGRDLTLESIMERLREDERFLEVPASGYFVGREDFVVAAGRGRTSAALRDEASAPSSSPLSDRAPTKPASHRSGSMRAVKRANGTTDGPPSSGRTPMSDRAPKKPPSGQMRAVRERAAVSVPPSPDRVVASGDSHLESDRFDARVAEYKKALMLLGVKATRDKLAIYVKIGRAQLRAGKSREALSNFEKALRIDPLDEQAGRAATELLRKSEDYAGLERLLRRRLELQKDDEERFETLRAIAKMWLEDANDLKKGAELVQKAAELRPDDPGTLELLASVEDRLGRHARAVAALRRLAAALPEPGAKAAVLARAAKIASDHLPIKADAIDLATAALEVDASALDALEIAASELGKKRRWRDLAELYESVLEKTRERDVAWDLAKKLGILYRDELDDIEGAMRAFDRALAHGEADVALCYFLAELHAAGGDEQKAVERYQHGARYEPRRADLHRRALWAFENLGRKDAAWRAAAALDLLGEADINESLLADEHRPEGQLAVGGGLTEEDWLEGLFSPERDDDVNAILATVAARAIELRLEALGKRGGLVDLDPATRHDPASSTTMLARTFAWTSKLLGIDLPELHVLDDVEGELVAVPTLAPTALASKKLGSGLSVPELAFLCARNLALHRSEHRLVVFFPTLRELAILFVAALFIGGEDADASSSLDGEAAEFALKLSDALDEDEAALLRHAVSRFEPARARRRVRQWAHSIQFACNRAGLLACGDIELAARLIERFGGQTEASAEEQIGDLLAYSISDAYGTLRERIGVSVSG